MKRLIHIYLLLFIIAVSLYLILHFKSKNNRNGYVQKELELTTKLEKILTKTQVSEQLFLTEKGDSMSLGELFGSKDKLLIYRIPIFYCSSCVDRELEFINDINKNELLPVVVLSSFYKYRDFKVFSHYNASEKITFCNSGDKFLSIDSLSKSYYIILNNELVIQRAFFPVKLSAKQSIDFQKSL